MFQFRICGELLRSCGDQIQGPKYDMEDDLEMYLIASMLELGL